MIKCLNKQGICHNNSNDSTWLWMIGSGYRAQMSFIVKVFNDTDSNVLYSNAYGGLAIHWKIHSKNVLPLRGIANWW